VTEPTLSGGHDLKRVLALARHFGVPTAVCVNKWDLNPGQADRIEKSATESGAQVLERIPYDRGVTAAQVKGKPVVETGDCPAARAITRLWEDMCRRIA